MSILLSEERSGERRGEGGNATAQPQCSRPQARREHNGSDTLAVQVDYGGGVLFAGKYPAQKKHPVAPTTARQAHESSSEVRATRHTIAQTVT